MHKYLRIKDNALFSKMFKSAKRAYSASMTVLYLPSDVLAMGVAVSKKHGKAVVRNRVKRLCREVFRLSCDRLNGSYKIIILPKVAENYDYKLLLKSMNICIDKINGGTVTEHLQTDNKSE